MPSAKAEISLGNVDAVSAPCNDPVLLPERKLTQAEVEYYWSKDRASLVVCRDEKGTLVGYLKSLNHGFSASRK